jgi:hypothetical protein
MNRTRSLGKISSFGLIAALSVGLFLAGLSRAKGKPLGDHYLLLVNTAYAPQLNAAKIAQFNKSPYDGLAVAFLHTYETSPVPSPEKMDEQIKEWKALTKKQIWPWVFINRLLGIDPANLHPYTSDAYFKQIHGMDFDGKTGARGDFLQNWQNALQAARETQAPGIVFDPEFYNYQKEYEIPEMAKAIGKSPQETIAILRGLGAQMADLGAAKYPGAVLWFLFTGMTHPDYKVEDGASYYPSPSYITMGLLDEIQRKHLDLQVLSGGEGSIGYCHDSVEQFRTAIRKRESDYSVLLTKYTKILELAGTMTVWSDRSAKKGWVKEGMCETSSANTVEDLEPYLELLLQSYRYNWIYGSVDGGYFAFEPSAARFDAMIEKAKARTIESTAR